MFGCFYSYCLLYLLVHLSIFKSLSICWPFLLILSSVSLSVHLLVLVYLLAVSLYTVVCKSVCLSMTLSFCWLFVFMPSQSPYLSLSLHVSQKTRKKIKLLLRMFHFDRQGQNGDDLHVPNCQKLICYLINRMA